MQLSVIFLEKKPQLTDSAKSQKVEPPKIVKFVKIENNDFRKRIYMYS